MTIAQDTTGLVRAAEQDRRVARQLAAAERVRLETQGRIAAADAQAARRLQAKAERARLAREERAARRAEARQERAERQAAAARRRAEKEARKAARRAVWAARWAAVGRRLQVLAPVVAQRVVLVGPIVFPMGVAWVGQIGFATKVMGWVLPAAVCFAAAWELSTVYIARLAYQARQDGDRAVLLRAGTWVLALAAATMNYWHEAPDWRPNGVAVSYGVMSLMGITLWEAYTAVQHRRKDRGAKRKRGRRPSLGTAYWLRYPRQAWAAYSACIADPSITTVDAALAAGRRAVDRAVEQRARAEVAELARRAARKAARKGQAGPALAALVRLADCGVVAQVPAITATPAQSRLGEPAHPPAGESTRGSAHEPSHASAHAPVHSRAHEPAQSYIGESAHESPQGPARVPAQPNHREPARASRRVRAASAQPRRSRRLTVAVEPAVRLADAYAELSAALGREPSGSELAERAGVSKATANRWKSQRPGGAR